MGDAIDITPLLTAKSAAVFGDPAADCPLRLGAPLKRRSTDRVDLALHFEDFEQSRAKLAVRVGTEVHGTETSLVIGKGGGLWLPGLRLVIDEGQMGPPPTSTRQVFIVAQRASVAAYLVQESLHRGLNVAAALATGRGGSSWAGIARAVTELPTPPLLVLALQDPITTTQLLEATGPSTSSPTLALLSHQAVSLSKAFGELPVNEVDAKQVASALGWAVFDSPGRLFAAARLLERGLRPRHGRALALVRHPDEAELLTDALRRAQIRAANVKPIARSSGLEQSGGVLLAPSRQHLISRALNRIEDKQYDVILCAGRVPRTVDQDEPQLSVGPLPPADPGILAGETTLHALASLLALAGSHTPQSGRQITEHPLPQDLRWLIDSGQEMLGEARTKRLLSHFDIEPPPERLVTSASAAAAATRDVGLPVTVKAIGPRVNRYHQDLGSIAVVTTASAARQAFHDVLFHCQQESPQEAVDGVAITHRVEQAEYLDCLLVWLEDHALLRICPRGPRSRRAADRRVSWRQCPLSQKQAARLAEQTLGDLPDIGRPQLQALEALLTKLSTLATTVDRLRWLHLVRIALPLDGTDAQVLVAKAERRHTTRR